MIKLVHILCILLLLTTTQAAKTITLISWNIKDFGQSRDDAEIDAIANYVKHADIVAIQEVVAKHPGGAQAVGRLVETLNRKGSAWDYRVSDPTQSSSAQKSERYAFLWKPSKVTITGGGPKLLSDLSDLVEREPYFIQFKVDGKELNILNYHACTHDNTYPERAEVNAITRWIQNQNLSNLIWTGDFNLEVNDIGFDKLKSLGFIHALNGQKTSLKRSCSEGQYLSRAEDNIYYKCTDFTLTRPKVLDFIHDCHEVAWKRDSYSDHLGVEVGVE